jgi:hypothetical protein
MTTTATARADTRPSSSDIAAAFGLSEFMLIVHPSHLLRAN